MEENVQNFAVLAGCMAFIGLLWWLHRPEDWEWMNNPPKRRGKMLKRERHKFVRNDATDGFVSYIEDKVAIGAYTRTEANELYRDLKKSFPIRNLFPSAEALKENIRRRLPILKESRPLPFPDRQNKKRHLFDKSS